MSFRNVTMLWMIAAVPLALVFLVVRERARDRVARRFASERLRGVVKTTYLRGRKVWQDGSTIGSPNGKWIRK